MPNELPTDFGEEPEILANRTNNIRHKNFEEETIFFFVAGRIATDILIRGNWKIYSQRFLRALLATSSKRKPAPAVAPRQVAFSSNEN